jgi:hypothetical protein
LLSSTLRSLTFFPLPLAPPSFPLSPTGLLTGSLTGGANATVFASSDALPHLVPALKDAAASHLPAVAHTLAQAVNPVASFPSSPSLPFLS